MDERYLRKPGALHQVPSTQASSPVNRSRSLSMSMFTCRLFTCKVFTCKVFTCRLFTCKVFTCKVFTCKVFVYLYSGNRWLSHKFFPRSFALFAAFWKVSWIVFFPFPLAPEVVSATGSNNWCFVSIDKTREINESDTKGLWKDSTIRRKESLQGLADHKSGHKALLNTSPLSVLSLTWGC